MTVDPALQTLDLLAKPDRLLSAELILDADQFRQ